MKTSVLSKIIEEVVKAFYTGTGYSGVHDPEYDMPDNTAEFHRIGFEKLKRYRTFMVDGNSIRVLERADAGGDPVTRITDVMTFNVQENLEAWLKKVGAKNISNDGKRLYSIENDQIEGDNTWLR